MTIVGIRYRSAGKIYYFDPGNLTLERDTHVIVETERGAEFGTVVLANREADISTLTQPLKKVLRVATVDDLVQKEANNLREEEYWAICQEKIKEHSLGMKLVDKALSFDLSMMTFRYTADGYVDFRELVKDLAATLRLRINMRQIPVRDEAKTLNGIGICGRTLCCATFMDDFPPISIKMAKDQGLSLNPTKISGTCGRLMCCLKHEEETYMELNANLPGAGDIVRTPDGEGMVTNVNILRQTVKVSVRQKPQDAPVMGVYAAGDITIIKKRPPCEKGCDSCRGCGGRRRD